MTSCVPMQKLKGKLAKRVLGESFDPKQRSSCGAAVRRSRGDEGYLSEPDTGTEHPAGGSSVPRLPPLVESDADPHAAAAGKQPWKRSIKTDK